MLSLLYRSQAVALLPQSELTDICLRSARKNQRLGITGFLVEYGGVFLQILEGEPGTVESLYAEILRDPRHHDVELLLREEGKGKPNFGFWAMNYGPLDDPRFWEDAFGMPMDAGDFNQRSRDPDFALDVLSRAYLNAFAVADVDSAVRAFVYGRLPNHLERER